MFELYSVVASLYNELPVGRRVGSIEWPRKAGETFSDGRRRPSDVGWAEGVFARLDGGSAVEKLPAALREVVYAALAPAA